LRFLSLAAYEIILVEVPTIRELSINLVDPEREIYLEDPKPISAD